MRSSSFGEDQIWLTNSQGSPSQRRSSAFDSIWANSNTNAGMGTGAPRSGGNSGGNSVSSGSGAKRTNGQGQQGSSGPNVPNGANANIWSMNRGSMGAPNDFVPQMPQMFNRNSFAGPAQSFSPKSPPQSEYENLGQYGINLRRHSYGDVYSNKNSVGVGKQPSLSALPPNPNFLQDDSTLEMVNEYFEKDPHEKVKVTVQLLNERYFDEEKYLGESYQLPKFPIENSLRNYQLVLVGFKAGRVDVFYLPASNEVANLKVGDLVIVEADRGRDLGKIFKMNISIDEARLMKLLQFQEQQAALSENDVVTDLSVKNLNFQTSPISPPTLHYPKPIISLAQPNDILQILNKKQDEEKACRLCLAKIANITNATSNSNELVSPNGPTSSNSLDLLQMKLIDAEYQFDRKKLIFYYSTHKRIDFRDLVRELFRIYKTRIWMCAVIGIPYVPNAGLQNYVSPILNNSSTANEQYNTKAEGGNQFNQFNMGPDPHMNAPFHNFAPRPGPGQGLGPGPMPMSGPSVPGQNGHFQAQEPYNRSAPATSGAQGPPPMSAPGQMPLLNDPFRHSMGQHQFPPYNSDGRLAYQGYYGDYNRRLSMQGPGEIPRKFLNGNGSGGDKEQDSNNESFVLKSLVDSIDH